MPIRIARNVVHLEGHCTVEEALTLLEALRKPRQPKIVLTACLGMHTALLQVLAAAPGVTIAPPADLTLAGIVMPFLQASRAAS
ncbi:hypothetical protein [Methylobacterium sp. Leaf85]|uniref:hypothetical protein n=1 Tax=Methylobacterium sp. Leaf85 TaxID=1736241 RepID=UPI0007001AB1|nr:hypothetical protein [Methylobacterium sp. Leaf85]KQO54066.1 hypothetical protein ASF08_15655 [Methylobacterium sp. Leaf85]